MKDALNLVADRYVQFLIEAKKRKSKKDDEDKPKKRKSKSKKDTKSKRAPKKEAKKGKSKKDTKKAPAKKTRSKKGSDDFFGDLRQLGRGKDVKGGRSVDRKASKLVDEAIKYISKLEKGPAQELITAMEKAIAKVNLYRLDPKTQRQLARKAPEVYAAGLRDMMRQVLSGKAMPALKNFNRPAFNYMVKNHSKVLHYWVSRELFSKRGMSAVNRGPAREEAPQEQQAPPQEVPEQQAPPQEAPQEQAPPQEAPPNEDLDTEEQQRMAEEDAMRQSEFEEPPEPEIVEEEGDEYEEEPVVEEAPAPTNKKPVTKNAPPISLRGGNNKAGDGKTKVVRQSRKSASSDRAKRQQRMRQGRRL